MRSTSGQHYAGLDHVRALAAFLVITWHLSHGWTGYPVPFNVAPEIALIDEGHVGVSLFMVLSGYLFAKLIAGRTINFGAFLWNRGLRLLPLLSFVLFLVGIQSFRDNLPGYAAILVGGIYRPTLPNGAWSITAEGHFYLLLPALLWVTAKCRVAPLVLISAAICARLGIFAVGENVQDAAYWTIIGRFDQFVLGIYFANRKVPRQAALAALLGISVVYYAFDLSGGFYNGPDWPWIVLTTVEGLAFGAIISWYDANPITSSRMWIIQKAGEYSYSIYLLHPFLVFATAAYIHEKVMPITNIYIALPWSLVFFIAMVGFGHMTYKLIEEPPLRFRRPYLPPHVIPHRRPSKSLRSVEISEKS